MTILEIITVIIMIVCGVVIIRIGIENEDFRDLCYFVGALFIIVALFTVWSNTHSTEVANLAKLLTTKLW